MRVAPEVRLNNGVTIPQLGLGVLALHGDEATEVVGEALRIGYRHIDTAQAYKNETQVGRAIARSGLAPEQVFVTSKLRNNKIGFDAALFGFDQTLADLGLEKIDLFLIHWPLPAVRDYVETWRAFERIYAEGRAACIGVSNFAPDHLRRLAAEADIVPAVNQIEVHPYLAQQDLLAFDAGHGIVTEAWSPLAQGAVLADPALGEIARTHDKTPAQVVLRWHVQRNSVVIPKTSAPARLRENFEIFDFHLSPRDMDRISGLDRHQRTGPDPDTYNDIPE